MRAEFPDFRLGNVLATSFTGTLTERHGNAVERIPMPHRLIDWLAVNGLAVDSCTTAQLELARELRESIHAAATRIEDLKDVPDGERRLRTGCKRKNGVLMNDGTGLKAPASDLVRAIG